MKESLAILIAGIFIGSANLVNGYFERQISPEAMEKRAREVCLDAFVKSNPDWPKDDAWLR